MDTWTPHYRLYVIEFRDGSIKVGITTRGSKRIREHEAAKPIHQHYMSAEAVAGFAVEREVVSRLTRVGVPIGGRREFFAGVRFSVAKQIALQIERRFVRTDEPSDSKNPKTRNLFAMLRFNDQELELLDAYCAKTGQRRSVACRQLALEGVHVLSHDANSFAPH